MNEKGDRRLQTMFLKVAGVDSAIDPILPYLVEVRTTILACNPPIGGDTTFLGTEYAMTVYNRPKLPVFVAHGPDELRRGSEARAVPGQKAHADMAAMAIPEIAHVMGW